ncbi:MAG: hypothetical protein ACYTEZ_06650 [Planctomycetota bacterium]
MVRILRALVAIPRVLRLYPTGHARVEAQVTELRCQLVDFFESRSDPLRFGVRGNSVELNREPITAAPDLTADFAFKLRRRRIRNLSILPGIERPEIKLIAELFRTDYKELLRTGGAHAFLARSPHPHFEISTFRTDSDEEGEEEEAPGATEAAAQLDEALQDPDVAARLEELRNFFGEKAAPQTHDDIEQLTSGFFARPEWAELDAEGVKRAVESFLDVVEHTVGNPGAVKLPLFRARVASLGSFFRGVDPQHLAKRFDHEPAAEAEVVHSTAEVEQLLEAPESDLASTTQTVREHLQAHPHEENALLILCELMVSALNRDEYHERRHMFLNAVGDERYSSSAVARILRHIAVALPPITFETRDELVQTVFDHTKNEEALMLFLVSMTDRSDVVRPILKRLSASTNPFPLLVRMLGSPALAPFRSVLSHLLVEAGREKKQTLARWARRNRAHFFEASVFEALFAEGTLLIGSICKEILAEGEPDDRRALIRRLRVAGTSTALRLLVLGVPYGDDVCDPELLLALGEFGSPLACGVLRDVVHRNNTREFQEAEARAAIEALCRFSSPEGKTFLQEVLHARAGVLLHTFCRQLRRLASDALAGKRFYPGGGVR